MVITVCLAGATGRPGSALARAMAALEHGALQPPVSLEPPQTSEATIDPAWRSVVHGANTILQLRHLGLGWVTVILPPHERANLLSVFLRQALSMSLAPAAAAHPPPSPEASSGGNAVN
jgi:hypothetical protein